MEIRKSLIKVDDCVLIVIDVQDHFLGKLSPRRASQLVSRVGWLVEVAKILGVPVVATAEEVNRYGGLTSVLAAKLPRDTKILDKAVFSLADQMDILDSVRKTGRRTAVLAGMETEVCVAQSALGLLRNGFQVIVLADVTDSPDDGHEFGLERIRGAGAILMSLKALYYEWVRTVSMSNKISEEHLRRIVSPYGITL